MKILKVVISASLLLVLTTACGNTSEPTVYNESATGRNNQYSDTNVDYKENHTFSLTDEEVYIYTLLKEELSTSVLKDVSPFSIAKIHIQAGIDGQWEAEYAMFSEVGREMSSEEWNAYFEYEMSLIDQSSLLPMANSLFSLIDEGEFIQDSETEAHILFESIYGDALAFRFIKNYAGIWEVRFHPIEFV